MSRRRKDKRKRRAQKEEQPLFSDPPAAEVSEGEEKPTVTVPEETEKELIFEEAAPQDIKRPDGPVQRSETDAGIVGDSWFSRNRENLLLGILVLYVLLLGLGTAGELFEIEWVLNLPIFK